MNGVDSDWVWIRTCLNSHAEISLQLKKFLRLYEINILKSGSTALNVSLNNSIFLKSWVLKNICTTDWFSMSIACLFPAAYWIISHTWMTCWNKHPFSVIYCHIHVLYSRCAECFRCWSNGQRVYTPFINPLPKCHLIYC